MSEIVTISETQRVQNQTNEEWLAEYERGEKVSSVQLPKVMPEVMALENKRRTFKEEVMAAGILSCRYINGKLLIKTQSRITDELDTRIKSRIKDLVKISEPMVGEQLYEYLEYRTFIWDKGESLAIVFRNISTGEIAERYFNIDLKKASGERFKKIGVNGQFNIKGRLIRAIKGSFNRVWLDAVGEIPENRTSHIYRKMNTWLSGVVFSCDDTVPHNGIIKLSTIVFEGRLYNIPS